jgi:hypothetical protein
MLDYLQAIIRPIVEHPNEVRYTVLDGEKTFIAEMRCSGSDIGKIIGRNGKNIGAVRTLMSSAAARLGRRAVVEVVE